MKLMWFHLMPDTKLSGDLKQMHPSVWVDCHSPLSGPKRACHLTYHDFMDELECRRFARRRFAKGRPIERRAGESDDGITHGRADAFSGADWPGARFSRNGREP
jgi:hypothetical protein